MRICVRVSAYSVCVCALCECKRARHSGYSVEAALLAVLACPSKRRLNARLVHINYLKNNYL